MLRRAAALAVVATVLAAPLTACADDGTISRARTATSTTTADDGAAPSTTDAPDTDTDAEPGAADIGDPLVPGAGNGGYDVGRYDLDITVADDRASITAAVTITATATQDLSAFNLDFASLEVLEATVDGEPATTTHTDDELTITPAEAVADGDEFTTVVRYRGSPEPVEDPSAPGTIGWLSAPTGTYVAAEPTGAKGFFPCNDHPSDKAMFSITVTAADADTVVANGTLTSKVAAASPGHTTWTFDQTDPMATYLVQIAVGDYDLVESTGPRGIPIRHAVVRHVTPAQREVLDETAAQLEYFESLFGPFPLDNYGLLVADSLPEFALETQTLTLLPAQWLNDGPEAASGVMAHELAHQWFGDAITPSRWTDIWLNEGFATYAEWLWDDHAGLTTLDAEVTATFGQAQSWRNGFGPVGEPEARLLFSPNSYGGAALVLHALRLTVGDDAFFEILRTWVTQHDGTSAGTADFEAVATEVSGQDLGAFFDDWLRSTTLPALPG